MNVGESANTLYFAKWALWCSLWPGIGASLLCSPRDLCGSMGESGPYPDLASRSPLEKSKVRAANLHQVCKQSEITGKEKVQQESGAEVG